MSRLIAELRYAVRSLNRSRGFSVVAVLTLALGVGANTAVFSLLNAVLLRPLPYDQPDRLVLVWESAPFFNLHDSPVSPANYTDWRTRSRSFEEMGALEDRPYRLAGDGASEVVQGSLATASLFRVLRTRPALGRIFLEQEDRPGSAKVVMISDGFWRRRFNADSNVIGKTIRLDEEQHTVVGVLAPGTEPPSEYSGTIGELWTPLGSTYLPEEMANRGRHNWMVAARLRSGVPLARANAEMQAIGDRLSREFPDTNAKVGAFVAPMREHFVRSSRTTLLVLFGTVGFILLIACSNLANLLLTRAANRSKEVAVRTALGAGGWQLARQFLLESFVLCTLGSALGLVLGTTTFRFLAHLAPGDVAGLNTLDVDWRVLAFTLGIAVLTAITFGLAPMLQARKLDVAHSLKQSARSLAAAAGAKKLRAVLICSEVALAVVLLIGAGLLIRTFASLRGVNVGFRTDNILTMKVPAVRRQMDAARGVAFQREVFRRVTALPGVVSAGFINHIPLAEKGDISGVGAEGHGENEKFQCNSRVIGPGYLQTMGIPLVRGRDIDERDVDGAPPVALINETLARTLWPNQDPIGRRLIFRKDTSVPVAGVVGDIHQSGLDVMPKPEFYVSALQVSYRPGSLVIHTRVDAGSVTSSVREAIWSIDPDQPITAIATMEEILEKEVLQRRVQTTLLAGFAGLALLLAAIGLYGVLAYLVSLQTPEIGLRMALGAAPANMLRRVVGQALGLTLIGVAAGVVAAMAMSSILSSLLFGVTATDPLTYVGVVAVLVLTAGAASYLPARRAMGVDPIVALREE